MVESSDLQVHGLVVKRALLAHKRRLLPVYA
jgi:hypothetical protein